MLNAKNESNGNTDWWFIYKTPDKTGSQSNEGYQYLYYDDSSSSLSLSANTLDQEKGALSYTLSEIFNGGSDQGYIVYNDEQTDEESNDGSKGHCKGILVFNKKEDSGLILLHSTPRFPAKGEVVLPDREKIYGQTFICITLPDYKTVNDIAAQMLQQQDPQVLLEDSYLPDSIDSSEALARLYNQTGINESQSPSTVDFKSRAGKEFKFIAKSKVWGRDFWIDLVSPELEVDLNVESWRRGKVTESTDKGITEEVEDVMEVDLTAIGLPDFQWKYTKDHSKWAAVELKDVEKGAWVCVADINRMVSQEKRGGGAICFKEENLWKSLNSIEAKLQVEPQT